MEEKRPFESIPDDELLCRLTELLRQSRRVESELVAHIAEVDARRLYAREASSSMFAYCTDILHLSQAEAYLRIAVGRATRRHPMLLALLAEGRLHLTGIAKLAPHLTLENREALLNRATHMSKRRVEELVAEISPRPDIPAEMRRLPRRSVAPTSAGLRDPRERQVASAERPDQRPRQVVGPRPDGVPQRVVELCPDAVAPAPTPRAPSAPPRAPVVVPLAPDRYKVQFTASGELRDKLERLQALLRSEVPDGDLAAIIEQAVTEKIERLEARRYAKTSVPRKRLSDTDTRSTSRHIPASVRRAVSERDGNRCCYVDERGRRCAARDRLEFHHRHPFSMGGDHSLPNIGLVCRAHNAYLAERDYGKAANAVYRPGTRGSDGVSSPRSSA